jgi:hypothetical protein
LVNGELTEQVQREVIRHMLIVKPGRAAGMRSALPVFLAGVAIGVDSPERTARPGGPSRGPAQAASPARVRPFLWSSVG